MQILDVDFVVYPTLDEKYQHFDNLLSEAIAALKIHAATNIAARWLLIDLYYARKRLGMVYAMLKGGE